MRYLIILLMLGAAVWWHAFPGISGLAPALLLKHLMLLAALWSMLSLASMYVMAARPHWLEQRMGGLATLFRQHRLTGYLTGVLMIAQGVGVLLMISGFIPSVTQLSGWFLADAIHSTADRLRLLSIAIVFYSLQCYLICTLVRLFPFSHFQSIHKLGVVLFMMAAIHSYFLMPDGILWTPFGMLMMAAIGMGLVTAIWFWAGQPGRMHRFEGKIVAVREHAANVLEVEVKVPTGFNDEYLPGQFALLRLNDDEAALPFTVVREDLMHDTVIFAVKSFGEHFQQLRQQFERNKAVKVEGPYGRFVLPESGYQEYWIAEGIGITPFMAWLEGLVAEGERRPGATLYYCVNRADEVLFEDRLRHLTEQTGVKLIILNQEKEGLLDVNTLEVDEDTKVCFCGPKGMRKMLQKVIPSSQLFYERFDYR